MIKEYLHWLEENQEVFQQLPRDTQSILWKEVEGHPGYFISQEGEVWNSKRKVFLTIYNHNTYKPTHLTAGGYPSVKIQTTTYPIHILLGRHFLPNPHNYPCVLHREDNRSNYHLDNLYWGTQSDNSYDTWNNSRKRVTYTFTTQAGETITTSNLTLWCKQRNIPMSRVSSAIRRNQPVNTTPGRVDKWGNKR